MCPCDHARARSRLLARGVVAPAGRGVSSEASSRGRRAARGGLRVGGVASTHDPCPHRRGGGGAGAGQGRARDRGDQPAGVGVCAGRAGRRTGAASAGMSAADGRCGGPAGPVAAHLGGGAVAGAGGVGGAQDRRGDPGAGRRAGRMGRRPDRSLRAQPVGGAVAVIGAGQGGGRGLCGGGCSSGRGSTATAGAPVAGDRAWHSQHLRPLRRGGRDPVLRDLRQARAVPRRPRGRSGPRDPGPTARAGSRHPGRPAGRPGRSGRPRPPPRQVGGLRAHHAGAARRHHRPDGGADRGHRTGHPGDAPGLPGPRPHHAAAGDRPGRRPARGLLRDPGRDRRTAAPGHARRRLPLRPRRWPPGWTATTPRSTTSATRGGTHHPDRPG